MLLLAPFAECIQPGQCKHCRCKRTIPSEVPHNPGTEELRRMAGGKAGDKGQPMENPLASKGKAGVPARSSCRCIHCHEL